MNSEEFLWEQKYRPKTVEDCILPDRIKDLFRVYVKEGNVPGLLLHGNSGVGKTTIAMALCNDVDCDHMIINGSDESGIDVFRTKIKQYATSMSLMGGRKVIIIDEADYLNPNSMQPALRSAIEEVSHNCTFIFTCNYPNRLIEPLRKRFNPIDFTLKNSEKAALASGFFKRAKQILAAENVEFETDVLIEIIKKNFPDFRQTLIQLQNFSKLGKIDSSILSQIKNVSMEELVTKLREKDFSALRKWVAVTDVEPTALFRQIYDSLYDVLEKSSIPKAVLILADYSYKQSFVNDQQINLMACLTELMIECEFKGNG